MTTSIFSFKQIYFEFSSYPRSYHAFHKRCEGISRPMLRSILISDKSQRARVSHARFRIYRPSHPYYAPAATTHSDRIAVSESHFAMRRCYRCFTFFFPLRQYYMEEKEVRRCFHLVQNIIMKSIYFMDYIGMDKQVYNSNMYLCL